MPRKYDLGRRAEAAAATRRRIVDVTVALHAEQGIAATSYRDVAARAAVGIGTVYNHFPAADDLIAACGAHMWEQSRPPETGLVEAGRTRRARLHILVTEVFAWYERYPSWRRGLADAGVLPAVAKGVGRRENHLQALVAAALGPDADPGTARLVRAVVDFEVYRSLTDAGDTCAAAAQRVAALLAAGL